MRTALAFRLNSTQFLARLNELQRRFDEIVLHAPLTFAGIDDDVNNPVIAPVDGLEIRTDEIAAGKPKPPVNTDMRYTCTQQIDEELAELIHELFGASCWATLIATASLGGDEKLVESARHFLMRCAMIVQHKGLAVWLYDLMNTASIAVVMREANPNMPVTIRPMSRMQMSRWLRGDGRNRMGTKKQREADMMEYAQQAHHLAASYVLQWGSPAPTVQEIAALLLSDPGIGMCVFREVPTVRAQGASSDMRFRRVVEYYRNIRVQADLEYAKAFTQGEAAFADEEEHCELTLDMDRRYLYDARRLVDAYRALWKKPASELQTAQTRLEEIELNKDAPQLELWQDPAYLRYVAHSLLGSAFATDLVEGFENRNEEQFGRAVENLEKMSELVRSIGLLVLPICVMNDAAPQWDQPQGNYKERTEQLRTYRIVCSAMAEVILMRFHCEDDEIYRAPMARALLSMSVTEYCDVVLPLFERELEEVEHQSVEEGENGVDIAA